MHQQFISYFTFYFCINGGIITKESQEKVLFTVTSKDFIEEKIHDILEYVKLIYPRNSFTLYVLKVKEKMEKEGKIFYINDLSKICSEHWSKMSEEKKPYKILNEKEKKEFKKSLKIFKHHLFKDSNGIIHMVATPYKILLNEKILEGFEKDLDPKEVKKKATFEWKNITPKKQKNI